ncbi:hypothetical protein EZV62_024288 [Acer yangbiense]|uniref:Protein TAR1 n=1 Tax=Acer yangbiense TaxID=1000413 RepID=A0A5C7H433_9ROSI|nr:hypothetical protein EZV62_024288 [Acer yangbiense]
MLSLEPFSEDQGRSAVQPVRDPANQLPCALRVYWPVDSHTCQTPWSVFQDGPNGELAGRCQERAGARGTPYGARCQPRSRRRRLHRHIAWAWATAAIRIGPRPESIGGPACDRSTSDRGASPAPIRFPPDNFKHSLTLFSKSFSSFPRGTCLLSVSRPYLALDGIYRPIWDTDLTRKANGHAGGDYEKDGELTIRCAEQGACRPMPSDHHSHMSCVHLMMT